MGRTQITCCRGCERRTIEPFNCHNICKDYLDQRREYEETRRLINAERSVDVREYAYSQSVAER